MPVTQNNAGKSAVELKDDSDDEDEAMGMLLPKDADCVIDNNDENSDESTASPRGAAPAPAAPAAPASPGAIPAPKAPLLPKKQKKVSLDDFELIKVLGKGSFGKVWKVRRKGHQSYYAMKVMSKRVFWKQNLVELLRAEKSTMMRMKHPLVVSLRWAWQTGERAFLVMDYMPGGELAQHLNQAPGHRFDEGRTRFYVAQIVLALEYLHNQNIMYRDMKPDNVVLDKNGNAMLIDFGLAKPLAPHTKDGGANYFGQPNYYLSPEMLKGEPFGLEVDWWMFGVLIYQMMVGAFPWTGRTVPEVHAQVIHPAPVLPPAGIMSQAASNFITQILWKDRSRRMRTVAQVKAHPWLQGINWDLLVSKTLPTPYKPPEEPAYEPVHPIQGHDALSYCPPPNQSVWLEGFSFTNDYTASFVPT